MTLRRIRFITHLHRQAPDEPAVLGAALNEVFVPILRKQFPESRISTAAEGCS